MKNNKAFLIFQHATLKYMGRPGHEAIMILKKVSLVSRVMHNLVGQQVEEDREKQLHCCCLRVGLLKKTENDPSAMHRERERESNRW